MASEWSWLKFCLRGRTSRNKSFIPVKSMATRTLFVAIDVCALGGTSMQDFAEQ
jgi:hypothetical protein